MENRLSTAKISTVFYFTVLMLSILSAESIRFRSISTRLIIPRDQLISRCNSTSGHFEGNETPKTASNTSNVTYLSGSEFNGMKTNKGLTIQEDVVFEGYRNIVRRKVHLPNGKQANFDVLIQRHLSVVVFIWDTNTSTTTLIREYHPGPEQFLYGTVAGMYEFHKHTSPLQSAQYELEEEAQLQTDKWYSLIDESNAKIGMPFDKYSNNHFFPYLALDCIPVSNPKAMDDEEYIIVERDVTYERLMNLMKSGQMNVVSTFTILLGLRKLTELGIQVGPQPSST
jgi:hypothetical protein